MNPIHKQVLRKNQPFLVKNLDIDGELLDQLTACEVLSDSHLGIISAKSTKDNKIRELLSILPRCGPKAFELFITAIDQDYVVSQLLKTLEEFGCPAMNVNRQHLEAPEPDVAEPATDDQLKTTKETSSMKDCAPITGHGQCSSNVSDTRSLNQRQRRGITVELTHKLKKFTVHECKIEPAKETTLRSHLKADEISYGDPSCYQFVQTLSLSSIEGQMLFRISETDSTPGKAPGCYMCVYFNWSVSDEKPTHHVGFSDKDSPNSYDLPQKMKLGKTNINAEGRMSHTTSESTLLSIKLH